MTRKNISIVTVVYNEETRMQSFVENFRWSNDIVIIDKSSPDRTAEVARTEGARCFVVPYTENIPPEMDSIVSQCVNDWIFMVTASDIIHPALVEKVLEEINKPDFNYDIIEYPFINHVFGISSTNSPWDCRYRNRLFRRSSAQIKDSVHREVTFTTQRTLRLPFDPEKAIHHLTHETLDIYFERHHRYAQLEVERFKNKKPSKALFITFANIVRAVFRVTLGKRSFLLGRDGIALSIAYVLYFMLIFLYTWQHFFGVGETRYAELRKQYGEMWRSRAHSPNRSQANDAVSGQPEGRN